MIDGNSSDRYILEIGLEYPDELHEMDNDYPLALKKHKIIYDMLSEYCSDIAHNYKIKIGNVNKLVPNLNYVLYHGNRHLYLSLGTKLTRVHRILKLKQYD